MDNYENHVNFPQDKTIQQLFEEWAVKSPEHTAVIFRDECLTYGELNSKANQVAHYLRNVKKVETNEIIGISMDRSMKMIIGILGIIKAGAAYLPISSELPYKRLEFISGESNLRLILTHNKALMNLMSVETVEIEDALNFRGSDENPINVCTSTDPIYVIYTSGSTGRPKGVVVEHRAVVNRLNWMQRSFALSKDDVILQKTPIMFDVSVWELFWWAISGAKMCLLDPGMEKFPQAIIEAVEKYHVTMIHFVPSMFTQFMKYIDGTNDISRLSSIRYVFTSGEILTPVSVELFNKSIHAMTQAQLVNLYGPTEATVDVTYFNCPTTGEIKKISIGKPIDNIRMYILNHGEILSHGSEGEIGISGVGLARGYLNQPELTMNKFINHPMLSEEKIYLTGDLGTIMEDGNIEFYGRQDCQVKVRGLRIELEEIEATALKLDVVRQCVVTCIEKNSDDLLVAYVVLNAETDIQCVRVHLKEHLPRYMVPNKIIVLKEMPLLPSGKVDRGLLKMRQLRPIL